MWAKAPHAGEQDPRAPDEQRGVECERSRGEAPLDPSPTVEVCSDRTEDEQRREEVRGRCGGEEEPRKESDGARLVDPTEERRKYRPAARYVMTKPSK